MARPSRRAIIAAGVALPLSEPPAAENSPPMPHSTALDPLVASAEEWIALRERVDALGVEADDLQGLVFDKAKVHGISSDQACRSSMSEARAWRAKKREFDKGERSLETLARVIRGMQAITVAGAIAKIELGLHIQYDEWSEHAFALVEDGIAELRYLMVSTVDRRHCGNPGGGYH